MTTTYRTDAWGVPTATTGGSGQPFGFTGEPADATGLTYLRARYYDPMLGRFLSRDTWAGSLMHPLTMGRYAYAANNPHTFVDHSGHCPTALGFGAAGAAVGSIVPGPGTAVGSAGGATVGFVVCLAAVVAGAILVKEVVIDPIAESREDPTTGTREIYDTPFLDLPPDGGDPFKKPRGIWSKLFRVILTAIYAVSPLLNQESRVLRPGSPRWQ